MCAIPDALENRKLVLHADEDACGQADNGHAKGADEGAVHQLEEPPSLIADAPGLQIWHKLDRTFKRPTALAYLCITPRCAYDSARTAALTHLALKLLQDDVNETAYLADVAGLGYDVSSPADLSNVIGPDSPHVEYEARVCLTPHAGGVFKG